MAFDPLLPAANAPVSSAELRNQFNGLQQNIQAKANEDDCMGRLMQTARNPTGFSMMNLEVSNPPTQEQVQAIATRLDELLVALAR